MDTKFRPAALTRCRWQSVWLAFHRGATLPPISVIQVGDDYAIRDGHHEYEQSCPPSRARP